MKEILREKPTLVIQVGSNNYCNQVVHSHEVVQRNVEKKKVKKEDGEFRFKRQSPPIAPDNREKNKRREGV